AKEMFFGVQNSRKARVGGLAGLLDPALMARKQATEKTLKEAVEHNSELRNAANAWERIAQAEKVHAANIKKYTLLESSRGRTAGFNTTLFEIARTLIRAAEERQKPNGERLPEYRDSNKQSLELELFSDEPLYDDFEQLKLVDGLTWLCGQLGYEDPL